MFILNIGYITGLCMAPFFCLSECLKKVIGAHKNGSITVDWREGNRKSGKYLLTYVRLKN
jgi:hypothetical protein